jgi:hypothetical protein
MARLGDGDPVAAAPVVLAPAALDLVLAVRLQAARVRVAPRGG